MMNMGNIVHIERGGSSELDPYKGNTIKQNVLSIRRSAVPRLRCSQWYCAHT